MAFVPIFHAHVDEGGDLSFDPSEYFRRRAWLRTLSRQHIEVVFRRPHKQRSTQANRYLWGVIYALIAEKTGHSADDLHEYFKERFLPGREIRIGRVKTTITGSTAVLNTEQFREYCDQVKEFAWDYLDELAIPNPDRAEVS